MTYETETGLPTAIPVLFDTDIEIVQGTPGSVGKAWVVWSLTESPNDGLYTAVSESTTGVTFSDTAAGTGDGTMTFALTRSATDPRIDTYVFSITAKLMYQNTAELAILMYERTYDITVERKGSATIGYSLDTTGTTSSLSTTVGEIATPLVEIASPATGLALVTSGGPYAFPAPIVLTASSTDAFYKVWFSDKASVKVFSDIGLATLVYEWPSSLVESTAESEGPADVTVTLNSVPEALYDMNTLYVALNVNFRDTEGDDGVTRALRRMLEEAYGNGEEQKASVVAEVKMVSADSGSYQVTFLGVSSAMAGAAAALLL